MDMHNIESTHGSTWDTSGLHRSKDPGAGASTPYHRSLTEATEDIPAVRIYGECFSCTDDEPSQSSLFACMHACMHACFAATGK